MIRLQLIHVSKRDPAMLGTKPESKSMMTCCQLGIRTIFCEKRMKIKRHHWRKCSWHLASICYTFMTHGSFNLWLRWLLFNQRVLVTARSTLDCYFNELQLNLYLYLHLKMVFEPWFFFGPRSVEQHHNKILEKYIYIHIHMCVYMHVCSVICLWLIQWQA